MVFSLNVNMERPLQAQLFEQVRAMIIDGQLKAGSALPATRALSEQLGVSRNTVILAYDRLLSEGYIESKRSIGTFVSVDVPRSGRVIDFKNRRDTVDTDADESKLKSGLTPFKIPKDPVQAYAAQARSSQDHEFDFHPKALDGSLFPMRTWRRIVNNLLMKSGAYVSDTVCVEGEYQLRRAIADHLGPSRGIIADPDDILIVGGIQEGRSLIAGLLASSSKSLLLETPSDLGVAAAFSKAQFELRELEVDDEGVRSDLIQKSNRFSAYVSPNFHYPTGSRLTLARRARLLEWAQKFDAVIVEDDTQSDFSYTGGSLTALKALDADQNIIYLGGFQSTLGPGLRSAYIVFPKKMRSSALSLKATAGGGASLLDQIALAEFLDTGAYDRHQRKLKKQLTERRDLLIGTIHKTFGEQRVTVPDGGTHIIWHLDKKFGSGAEIARKCFDVGVGIYTVSSSGCWQKDFDHRKSRDLIMGFGGIDLAEVQPGVKRIAKQISKKHNGVKL